MTDFNQIPEWGDADSMFSLSQSLTSSTQSYIGQLSNAVANLFPPVINPVWPTALNAPAAGLVAPPSLMPVTWTTPAAPAPFTGALNPSAYLPGPFQGAAPALSFGSAPAAFSDTAPTSPALNLDFTYPTVVTPTLPTAPTLLSINTVTFNPLTIPTFNVGVPTLSLSPPNAFSYAAMPGYASTELTMVQTSLSNAILNGTDTGLDIATQTNLFNAAYEREYRAQADALAALTRDAEVLGFAYPPGAFLDARNKLYTETTNTIAGLSRDIMVEQAKLHLENVTKARELAISLESKLIDNYNEMAQRSFEAAKYAVESAVAIYNAQAEVYGKQLEGYRVQAEVYATQIKGIEAQIEQVKAQIEFEKTKAEINQTAVNAYSEQIKAALAVLDVYKTEAEIIQIQANVEKTKVDIFSAQIQAFVGTVSAYTAQVEAYKANVSAQGEIENVYKTQVDAYSAQVDAGVKVIDSQIETYKAQIMAYGAQLDAYKAALQAQVSQAQSLTAYNTSQIEGYKGQVMSITSYNDVLTKQWEAVLSEQEQISKIGVSAAEANGQLYISARQLSLDASKTAAQVAAQLGAAALGAIHWSNSSAWSSAQSSSVSSSTSDITESIESA